MANAIELERRMAETNVEEALNQLKNVEETSKFDAIWLHLRFLHTFVNCAAKGCFNYKSLPSILTLIQDVGLLVQELPFSSEEQEIAKVLEKLKHLQPEVENVYLFMSQNSPECRVFLWGGYYHSLSEIDDETRDVVFLNFVSLIREDMRLLLQTKTNLVDILRNQIDILHENLIYIVGLLEVTSNIPPENESRNELFRHFQSIADTAAYLSYRCLADEMNEDQVSRLALQYSQLKMKIEPSIPEVRKMYIQALKDLRSWRGNLKWQFYPRIYFAESYVKVLVHLTKEIPKSNCSWVMDMKDGLELLHIELISLAYMVANRE